MRRFIFVLFNNYYYGDKIKYDGWAGHVARMGHIRDVMYCKFTILCV